MLRGQCRCNPIVDSTNNQSGLHVQDGLDLLSGLGDLGLHSGLSDLNCQPSWHSAQWQRSKLAGMTKVASMCKLMAANHVGEVGEIGPDGLGGSTVSQAGMAGFMCGALIRQARLDQGARQ